MKAVNIAIVKASVVMLLLLFPYLVTAQPQNVPVPLPGPFPAAQAAPGVTRSVNCNVGQTIQDAVNVSLPGDSIVVSGVCNENLVITEHALNLILDGQGAATNMGLPPVPLRS